MDARSLGLGVDSIKAPNLGSPHSVGDIFYLINFLFAGGPAPMGPGDANADGGGRHLLPDQFPLRGRAGAALIV